MAKLFFCNRDERFRLHRFLIITVIVATSFTPFARVLANDQSAYEDHKAIVERKVRMTLHRLYDAEPTARTVIERSSGYAVFTSYGSERGPATGEAGRGIAFNNKTGERIFMNVLPFEAQREKPLNNFRFIFVFSADEPFDRFVDGRFQVNSAADLLTDHAGGVNIPTGAICVAPAIFLYQLTDDGLTNELVAHHTKYYKNNNLN